MFTCWTTEVWFPAVIGIFPLRHDVQIGSGNHPASYPVSNYFLGNKSRQKVTLTTPFALVPRLRILRAIPPLPHTSLCRVLNYLCLWDPGIVLTNFKFTAFLRSEIGPSSSHRSMRTALKHSVRAYHRDLQKKPLICKVNITGAELCICQRAHSRSLVRLQWN
jgi:hypothetical protein